MSEYKAFVHRIGLLGITNILVVLSTFILVPLLTKSFGAIGYGIWIQVYVTVTLIPNIATLGLPYAMVRFLSSKEKKTEIQETFYSIAVISLVGSLVLSGLLFLLSEPIAIGLFNGDTNIARTMAIIVFFACLNVLLLNYFRTFQQMKRYSIFLLIQTYLVVFLIIYFVSLGQGIFSALIGLLITHILLFLIMISLIIYEIGFKIPKFYNIKEYLSFGIPTMPSNLSYWIVESSDRYIIGILLGATFVGYYSPAYTLGNAILTFLAPISILLPSVLPKYYDNGDLLKLRVFVRYSLKYFLLVSIPSIFSLSILSKPILMILSTPEIALNGYLVTPFVLLSALIFGIYGILSNIIILKKKTHIIGIIWIIAAILNLSLNIILVPYFGIIAAAVVTLLAYTLAFGITLFYSLKFFKFEFDFKFILKSIFASIVISLIIVITNPHEIFSILIIIGICAAVYIALIIILKGISKEEFKFLKGLLKSDIK